MPFSINGSTGISGLNGSAASPAIQGGDSNTGIFFGADTVSVATDGNPRLIVDANGSINIDSGGVYYDAANNRLGVGTTGPTEKLAIGFADGGTGKLEFRTDSYAKVAMIEGSHDSGSANGSLRFWTRSGGSEDERARIDSSGRLLVGTSSQQGDFTLQIQGDAASSSAAGSIYLRRGLDTATIAGNVGADLGSIDFGANDGTIAGRIECLSDAAWSSTSDTPGRLVFSTAASGFSSPTPRVTVDNVGTTSVGVTPPTQSTLKPDLITGSGVVSPMFWRPIGGLTVGASTAGPGYVDLGTGGVRVNLVDPHMGSGLGGSQFQSGLIASYGQTFSNTANNTTREEMNWNRIRLIFRGCQPGSNYTTSTVKFRYSTYHYSNGWQDHAGTEWSLVGNESERGARWSIGPWIDPSSYFTNWADVPALGLYYDDNSSGRSFRIAGGVYFQFAHFN